MAEMMDLLWVLYQNLFSTVLFTDCFVFGCSYKFSLAQGKHVTIVNSSAGLFSSITGNIWENIVLICYGTTKFLTVHIYQAKLSMLFIWKWTFFSFIINPKLFYILVMSRQLESFPLWSVKVHLYHRIAVLLFFR